MAVLSVDHDEQEMIVDGTKGEVRLSLEKITMILKGERVVLRPPNLEDLEYIRFLWADPATMEAVGGPVLLDPEKAEK